ncbi:hypothetical protein KDN24_07035 [Bacillus sp. Bva_UNVM-123]|uniref:hypothetical protein n=1 Tax=Bacillus sp. Bva_UNVM-123 TaxID=2829798 RepID=UPI00391F05E2
MHIIKYIEEAPDGLIKCTYIDILNFRILIALSESIWYTKNKVRRIPFWINNKGFFCYKLAIKIGIRKE